MLEKMIDLILQYTGSEEGVFFLSMLPLFELRASIPLALSLSLNSIDAFFVPFLGSLVPVPFLLYFLEEILEKFPKGVEWINRLIFKFIERAELKSVKVKKLGYLGLLLFVSIPFPGTGVWTGSIIASILGMSKKKALLTIILGNAIAGLLIYLLTTKLLLFI